MPLVATSQTKNYAIGLIHEVIIGKTVCTITMLSAYVRADDRVFTYNALGNAARQLQRCRHRQHHLPRCRRVSTAVSGTTTRIHTIRCILTVMSTGKLNGRTVVSRILVIYFRNRSLLLRTNINYSMFV